MKNPTKKPLIKKVPKKNISVEKLIYDIFRLCDRTVWMEDWQDFQDSFEGILIKRGLDLYMIYHGKSKEEFHCDSKAAADKWLLDKAKKVSRSKKRIVYIKDRPQGSEIKTVQKIQKRLPIG